MLSDKYDRMFFGTCAVGYQFGSCDRKRDVLACAWFTHNPVWFTHERGIKFHHILSWEWVSQISFSGHCEIGSDVNTKTRKHSSRSLQVGGMSKSEWILHMKTEGLKQYLKTLLNLCVLGRRVGTVTLQLGHPRWVAWAPRASALMRDEMHLVMKSSHDCACHAHYSIMARAHGGEGGKVHESPCDQTPQEGSGCGCRSSFAEITE